MRRKVSITPHTKNIPIVSDYKAKRGTGLRPAKRWELGPRGTGPWTARPTCRAPACPPARQPRTPRLRSPPGPAQRGVPPSRPAGRSYRQVRVAAVAVGHGSDDPGPPAAPAAALPALGTRVLAGRHAQEPLPHQLRPRLHRHGRLCAGNECGPLLLAAHAEEPTAGDAARERERPGTLRHPEPRRPRPLARPTGKLTGMCARPAQAARRGQYPSARAAARVLPRAGGAGVGGRRQVAPPHRLRCGTERQLPRDGGPRLSCFRRSFLAPSEGRLPEKGSAATRGRKANSRWLACQERRPCGHIAPSSRSPNPRAAPVSRAAHPTVPALRPAALKQHPPGSESNSALGLFGDLHLVPPFYRNARHSTAGCYRRP